jgi:mono/diheme cytochrome c family protein
MIRRCWRRCRRNRSSTKEIDSMRMLRLLVLGVMCAAAARAETDPKTARAWKGKCASCHGADGKGQTDQGKKMHIEDMTAASWQKGKTDAQIKTVIENGTKKGEAEMEGYKDKIDPALIESLVAYVRTLK